jgi:hypothetical protein
LKTAFVYGTWQVLICTVDFSNDHDTVVANRETPILPFYLCFAAFLNRKLLDLFLFPFLSFLKKTMKNTKS